MSEAHFSTSYPSPRQAARVPAPNGYPGREGGPEGAPLEGAASPVSLTWKTAPRTTFAELRTARTVRSGPLSVSWLPTSMPGRPVLAFAIGKRVGKAVARNRLRRRLRESARHLERLPDGVYLIRARPGATELGYAELSERMDRAITALTGPAAPIRPASPSPAQDAPLRPSEPRPAQPAQ